MNKRPLRVMLVDDESNIKNLLRLCIDWQSLNMEIAGDASSGLEAIDMAEVLMPDIIITDIQMPYMDGLELSKIIKAKHRDIAIVILTAHDEFAYAQSAVSIGVSDFILKPIDRDVLFETISRLGDSIISNRLRLSRLELSHQYIKNSIDVLQGKVLNDLISNSPEFSFQPAELSLVDINLDTAYDTYQVSLINTAIDRSKYTALESQMLLQNCCGYIKDSCLLSSGAFAFTDIYNNIVLLNNDPSIYLNDISEHAVRYFKEQLSAPVSCGIGMPVHGIGKVFLSYRQALNALKLCYITGEEITFADSQIAEAQQGGPPQHMLDDNLKLAIKSGSAVQAVDIASKILKAYARENINDLNGVKILALNIFIYVKDLLSEMKIAPVGDLSLPGEMLLKVFSLPRYSDVENTVTGLIEKACGLIYEALSTKSSSVVAQIRSYIDENFSDYSLTLTAVADKFFINSSYLSRIFKKDTGISFSEYLIKVRIENAMKLLEDQDYKAYQLAQLAGIPDPNYFVKCFKKISGMSFAEYKQKKGI